MHTAPFAVIARILQPLIWRFTKGLGLLVLEACAAVLAARAIGSLVEKGFRAASEAQAWRYGVLAMAAEGGSILLGFAGRRIFYKAAVDAIWLIRKELALRYNAIALSFYDKEAHSRLVAGVTYDVDLLESFFSTGLPAILTSFLLIVASIGAMLSEQTWIGLLVLCAFTPAIAVTHLAQPIIRSKNHDVFSAQTQGANTFLDLMSALPVVRHYRAERWATAKIAASLSDYLQQASLLEKSYAWIRPLVSALCWLPLLLLVALGGNAVLAGSLGLGVFVAFIRYTQRFSAPVTELLWNAHTIQEAWVCMERVSAFFSAPDEQAILGQDGKLFADNITGSIRFSDVSMGYDPHVPVLHGITLAIEAGEKIGFVGATGSGKTTVATLLARLYPYHRGSIYLDAHPIEAYSRASVRGAIGVISQNVVLFKGTLRDNLCCGQAVAEPTIARACEQTGLSRILAKRGLSLESQMAEKGANISIGERQLIALTRVLLSNPRMLILDEATANVDPELESMVHRAVEVVMEDRTCILIAHRLGTLQSCNRIYVFRQGCIVETGTHRDLANRPDGYYRQLLTSSE